jgi:hypothetical protein
MKELVACTFLYDFIFFLAIAFTYSFYVLRHR